MKTTVSISALLLLVMAASAAPAPKRQVNLAFFEAGRCPGHDILRDEFMHQLQQMAPDSIEFVTIPEGYRSADWNPDSCRIMAAELVGVKTADLVVTFGPWVVEDLLAAGYEKPIVALNRVDPAAEGLLDDSGLPIAPNLTVQIRPLQLARDIDALTRLVKVQKLGALYFPTGDETGAVMSKLEALGQRYGFEVVTAEGYDVKGAYAFFKAYQRLPKDIDALYLFPMDAMDGVKDREFFTMTTADRIPTFVWEGAWLVRRGAMACDAGYSVIPQARLAALNVIKIVNGATPADLPATFDVPPGLTINEATAAACGVEIPITMQREVRLVEAPTSDEAAYFNFNDAVRRAMEINPSHLARYDALEASVQAARQAYSDYLPHLYGRASAKRSEGDNVPYGHDYAAGVDLDQTIFSMETIRSIQAAAQQRHIAEVDLLQSQFDLELSVGLAYLDYLRAQEAYQLYIEDRNRVDRFLELAYTRRELENGPERDVTRWEQERNKAGIRVDRAAHDLEASKVLLNSLLNLPGSTEFRLDSLVFAPPEMVAAYRHLFSICPDNPTQAQIGDLLVAQALEDNPAVNVHREQIALQKKLLAQNGASFFPTLDFGASYNYRDIDWDWESHWPDYYDSWTTRLELRLPLFLGGQRFRERDRQKALLSREEYRRDDATLKLMREVLTDWDQTVTLAADMPSYARSADLVLTELQPLIEGYEAGKTPLIDILDAQHNSLSERLASVEARFRFYRTLALLDYRLGWSTYDSGQPPTTLFLDRVDSLNAGER